MNRILSYLSLILACFLIAWLLFLFFPGIFDVWRLQTNDYLFRLRYQILGKRSVYPSVVHVDVDDESIRTLDVAEVDKPMFARVIDVLTEAYVQSVGFDMIFLEGSDEEANEMLIDATSYSGAVYYAIVLKPRREGADPKEPRELPPDLQESLEQILWHPKITSTGRQIVADVAFSTFPELASEAKGIGHITAYPDRDGIFRRLPLLIAVGGGYVPFMSFRMVCDHLSVAPENIEVAFGSHIILRNAKFPDGRQKDIRIPIDEYGRMIINFAGPWSDSFYHYPISKVLEAEEDSAVLESLTDEIEEDLVIVSDVSTGGRDIGPVPYESLYPLGGLHANLISSIMKEDFIHELSPWHEAGISLFLILVLFLITLRMRGLGFALTAGFVLVLFILLSSLLFFYQNILLNTVRTSLAIFLFIIILNIYRYLQEEKEKAFVRAKFENYFAPELLTKILKTPKMLEACEKKELSVMFSDIAGFTSWSSTQTPEYLRQTLNEYFEEMAKIVFKYQGTIDKYIGDGLLVFFGDPIEQEDHALRAVKTAREMQIKTRELKAKWEPEGGMPIRIRIGINTGEVVVGNMGSSKRLDYTVIGANVNLAQRLESNAPVGGILISNPVYRKVRDEIKTKSAGKIQAKGFEKEIEVYEVELD